MLALLSPAKTLDFETPAGTETCTQPDFLKFSKFLIGALGKLKPGEIAELMSI
ncbi:MAG: peroxide stress protein YaaA, partial [Verrucomicrobiota bacterium]|nr:peroxide stress protein YaaA [Verrucomicrobiota bacterium]